MSMQRIAGPCAAFLFVSASPLLAQDLDFQVNTSQSVSDVSASTSTALPSTVIGDFDAATNPTGTQTIPGLFGGSGNNPIPMELALGTSTDFLETPTGQFGMDIDVPGLFATVHDLQLDLLGGASADSQVTLSMLYDTFRTVAPDSLYFGGFPLDIPLAGQSISDFLMVQSGPGLPAILVPGVNAGEFTFLASVPVEISFNVDLQGQVTPVGPLPMLLPMNGELVMNGGSASVTMTMDQAFQQQFLDPAPGFVIADVPLPLPTILPPGDTANLLLNATIASIDLDFDTRVVLVADSVASCGFTNYCNVTLNSTGLSGLLTASGSSTVADQNLTFTATNIPSGVNGMLFMSESRARTPIFGSDGILCLGAPQIRFQSQLQNSGPAGVTAVSPDFANLPQGAVFLPGSTWNFQVWHRDANPQSTSNTTDAVEVRFCP